MPILQTDTISPTLTASKKSLVFPLILVTSLFFLWGLAYGLLDVLNKHFQETLEITKQRSTLLQAAYFGAYFIMALPAGHLIKRWGYKNGIITGLVLYALGAFLFFPSASMESFFLFLMSLLVLASGLAFLETAANPYITVLGDQKTSAFRLNLSQSFNGVGSFIGPIIGAKFFFSNDLESSSLDAVQYVYLAIGMIVLIIAGLFSVTTLPEIKDHATKAEGSLKALFSRAHFKWAVVAQFFCVAAQVGGAALFINYCTETGSGMTNEQASYLLSAGLLLFTIGRFTGTALMRIIAPHNLLAVYAAVNVVLSCVVAFLAGNVGIYSLVAIFFFNSVMFPTIFALGVNDLGPHTKTASSFIIMAIVGGAIVPYVMGSFQSTALAYTVLIVCYIVIAWFAISGHVVKKSVDGKS